MLCLMVHSFMCINVFDGVIQVISMILFSEAIWEKNAKIPSGDTGERETA